MLGHEARKRIGKLRIDAEIMENRVEDIQALYSSGLVPFKVELLGYIPAYEIIAYHESFDKLEMGAMPLEYEAQFTRNDVGEVVKVEFLRVDRMKAQYCGDVLSVDIRADATPPPIGTDGARRPRIRNGYSAPLSHGIAEENTEERRF